MVSVRLLTSLAPTALAVRHAAMRCDLPPDLGMVEDAISQPVHRAQPAMATANVGGLRAMCRADPVLDQVSGLGLDDDLVHSGTPFRFVLVRVATSWAPCHVFNERLRVVSTPRARIRRVESGLRVPVGRGGRALPTS